MKISELAESIERIDEASEYSGLFREIKKTFKRYPTGGTRGYQIGIAIQNALQDLSNEGFLEQDDFAELFSFLDDVKSSELD